MAINCTWSVSDMQRDDSTGGVTIVYWSCVAQSDEDASVGTPSYSATEGGKLRLTYDADDAGFVAYDSLTEATVLGWVYNSIKEGDETADEAKARIEAERTAKVQAQITRNSSTSTGKPW